MALNPKVSVITPTYKRDDLLKDAIESVLAQSFTDFEYIIVDDGCSDDTKALVEGFNDNRIIYLRNEENPARTHCRPINVGLKHSKGEYIAYLDDDNVWDSFHLDVLIKGIERDNVDVVYCDMMVVQPDGSMQYGIQMDFDAQFLLNRNFIDTSEILHKREVAFGIGGWDEKVKRFTDWNFCVRAMKWGARFRRVPIAALKYRVHEGDTQSKRTEVRSWYDPTLGMYMFEPTFDPAGCYINAGYLGENKKETEPRIAIMTKTYERLDYTSRMWKSLIDSTDLPFDWYVYDQGSKDDTPEWLKKLSKHRDNVKVTYGTENIGISKADNHLLEKIAKEDYQIVVHVDNDCEFQTFGWLETLVDLWKRNHMLYMSPYPEGLVHNPGGSPRIGHASIGPYPIEVTQHIGGFCAFVDARAYRDFRWTDQFKHGNQDSEASMEFRKLGYMPCYIPVHRVMHMDTTEGQYRKYPDYFERRKKEKTEVA